MTIVLQIYPNGEFTHGVDTSHRRDRNRHSSLVSQPELIPDGDSVSLRSGDMSAQIYPKCRHIEPGDRLMSAQHGTVFTYLCADMNKHVYAIEYADGRVAVDTLWDSSIRLIANGTLVPIGSSSARVLQKTLKTRSRTGTMTKRMARRIRNIGLLLQQKYSHHNLSFLTLTLPNLSSEDLHKVSMNWGAMVHKFLEWLRYRTKLKNIPLEYVYCTEIQTKRLELKHEYALHIHLVFRGRYGKKAPWAITPAQARKEWSRCIRSCIGHGNFNKSALENLQRVKSSAAGYLSKYMSKGNCRIPASHEAMSTSPPPINWGGYSRSLSRALDEATISLRSDGSRGAFVRTFIGRLPELLVSGVIAFYRPGFIELFTTGDARDTRYLKVGVGRFACEGSRSFIDSLEDFLVNNCNEGLDNV